MAKTKVAASSTSTGDKVKTRKNTAAIPRMSPAQRAAAVDKNIGKTQLLRDFLIAAGWR